ncbi:MAG: HAMP domain-containing sensor histidine kinase, partial [bacterium]
KSDFVTITSHQLRAPITAVKGYASMVLEGTYGPVPEKLKQPLDRIFQSSDRLVRLIGDFLNLSRIERGKMEYDFQKFDLKELVKNLYEDFGQINRKRRVPLDFSLNLDESQKFMVVADQEKIRQAMSNITDNALKYTKKGFVKISLYKDDLRERIIFKIQDSGMGIDKEGLARIFQKFTRARNGSLSVHVEGTGLGLYVAKEILKEHEGDIRAESRGIGKGSAFYIELPMKFITPAERERAEKEQRERQENVEGFVKGI